MNNVFDVVDLFEEKVAQYAGSKYGVAVDSCSAALFLCCKYLEVTEVILPARTYPSAPSSVINAGGTVEFEDYEWKGCYQFAPYPIYDSAVRFYKDMYSRLVNGYNSLLHRQFYYCLSFHSKKHLPIGRGGMILTDDEKAVAWFKKARFDGRTEHAPILDDDFSVGWHYYMTPENAARGLLLMNSINDYNPDILDEYPDLSNCEAYRC